MNSERVVTVALIVSGLAAAVEVRAETSRKVEPALELDVLGVTQLGPSLELEIGLPARMSLGVSYRVTPAGILSHYIPDLYPGKGNLRFSQQIGIKVLVYPVSGHHHEHAGFFIGGVIEYLRFDFENGRGEEMCPDLDWCFPLPFEIQTVDILVLGLEAGQRWDFRSRFFIDLSGVVGVPIVMAFKDANSDGNVLSRDRKDANAVPPVGFRLGLRIGLFL